ncbi:TPA: 50S ribosomal protein L11 methyltransferase [Vibrio parahaemolyticus]|uniref:50S ribosomal protein L11 methyltransferase n=1 Tax=Vibrio parahaemolyticus TaxID=670 RepID=UPI0011226B95|nr:50S ribosomal protein L11 methyltransferase [Vibrio parahaemolyticus]EGQ9917572.1 50S ribosomal protein L11 methyltransferase [Vibrio parahaemolyticus]MBE3756521.1 50S ribosomal protein L11 methyltransferase [Vibrio parahaemolyticus]MDF4345371.1 50S ribosomal protein L11 methyltransferase [Vibrio parahaemolyticus]MDF4357823.1 50S ribosomal protein L11 methyltransferase [Vibrio parahaemolyticus]MDF4419245.1 50S ribosomal protein L11 methyltransferase [Vibrio parahaemolyticus]
MPWIQIKLNATNENAEQIGDMLMEETGALSVTFLDAQDTPVFEPLPGETRLWGDTDILALYDAEADTNFIIDQIKASNMLAENFAYKVEQLEDKDWEREWMENFHPMKFGERLWICPSWREVPEPDAVNVMLDPGLAFGTGTHPTTALCLEWLESMDLSGKTVIDFGCGSGILAIAAIKLGAEKVIGIDIDPQALLASKDNAERNGVADKLEVYLPQNQPEGLIADVVVANILAGPLRELAPIIKGLVKPNGALAMSGVLDTQAEDVASYYRDELHIDPIVEQCEWCRISGRKQG